LRVLALDTATPYLTLGWWGERRAECSIRLERRQAEEIWPFLRTFLDRLNVKLKDIEALVVGQGPGSYTGIRVAVALAQGLSRGLQVPLVGVDSLAGVASRYPLPVLVALTAPKGALYWARYQDRGRRVIQAPQVTPVSELPEGPWVLDQPPSGLGLARLGSELLSQGVQGVQPLYL
jgi:tRNA threonylcarbamoyl adenosine modification protein YeaZ